MKKVQSFATENTKKPGLLSTLEVVVITDVLNAGKCLSFV